MLSRVVELLILAVFSFGAPGAALSQQNYPQRPITIVVPFSAGGPTDVLARVRRADGSHAWPAARR